MVAGLVAGLIYAVFAFLFGEPSVDQAIAFEDQLAAAANEPPGEELVSRGVQSTVGLTVAAVVYGVAIGGLAGYFRNGTAYTARNPSSASTADVPRGLSRATRPWAAAYTSAKIPPMATP